MLSGLPLMRQVVGFLTCLKKNGLSNEKYVLRKRPRDFFQAGTLVVDIAAERVEDRLPKRGLAVVGFQLGDSGTLWRI
jgi:hypothetical protein